MKIGMIGLGKLGLPVALSIENKGHEVVGYDIDPNVEKYIKERSIPYVEAGTPELLQDTKLRVVSLDEVIAFSEIVFCPVQTPHLPMYEGITRIPDERVNFDYTYLKSAIKSISRSCDEQNKDIILVIISTVLPTTIETEIKPLLSAHIKLAYNPFFIAMGTTRNDFENPEFVLLGCDDKEAADVVESFYKTIHSKPVFRTAVKNAELIKVIYNTFISTKIGFINTVMEICEKMQCNVDEVSDALFLANERIISPKYLRGGMGDGGGCHPRDNIALSWLSRKLDLSYDWFENIMMQREKHTEWLAELIKENKRELPVVIFGKAFKRGTNLQVGSPSILLSNILTEQGVEHEMYDPYFDKPKEFKQSLFFIGTNHPEFEDYEFPLGSYVIDPWNIVKEQDGVMIKRIGRYD